MVRKERGPSESSGTSSSVRRGRSASTSTSRKPNKSPDGVQNCVSCSKDVGEDAIGCDKCEYWVHSTEMCSGLPQKVIDAITEYDGRGINFVCTRCRIKRESSASNNPQPLMMELVAQIFQQMKGICSTVQNLVNQVKAISSKPQPTPIPAQTTPTAPPAPNPPPEEYKTVIRKEVLEMREREKRRSSIIVKGLSASSPRDLAQKFSQLTNEVMGFPTSLSDVTPIPGHTAIYRAKILDDEVCKQVLDKAKTLKRTNSHSNVYITRDLTYSQRAELFARRQARRAEAGNQPGTAPSDPVTEPVSDPDTPAPGGQGNSHPQ